MRIEVNEDKLVLELVNTQESKTDSGFYRPISEKNEDVVAGEIIAGTAHIDAISYFKECWLVYFRKSQATEVKIENKVFYVLEKSKVLFYKEK